MADPRVGRPRVREGYGIPSELPEVVAPWSEITTKLVAARSYWISTTRTDGRPHSAPVWAIWRDDELWFSTDSKSVKGSNLEANPATIVHLESGDDVVIVEGVVRRIEPTIDGFDRFLDEYEAKYAHRIDAPDDPNFAFFVVRPTVVLSWLEESFVETALRWEFAR